MVTTNGSTPDLFCRVMAQSELPFKAFCARVGEIVGGRVARNGVTSSRVELFVDENDSYDPALCHRGPDRWLRFRYTLEITPAPGTEPDHYIAAVGQLLKGLWSEGIPAVGACEFETRLPVNPDRAQW